MTFTLPRTQLLLLGLLALIATVQQLLLPVPPVQSVLGALAAAPLWLLAGSVALRGTLTPAAALGIGAGLGAATVAATGIADTAVAAVVFLIGAAVQILIVDQQESHGQQIARRPADRVAVLLERAPEAVNDLRLVR